ncbi:MAG: InlB B-repeat-containing protein [bacterium]
MKKILILIIMLPILFLSSCGIDLSNTVSGDFVYTKWTATNDKCDISGLSSEGNKKETIVFPTVLDDIEVSDIDKPVGSTFKISNAKNVYYHGAIGSNVSILYSADNINLYISGNPSHPHNELLYIDLKNIENHTVYIQECYYDNMLNYKINFQKGNVVYYASDKWGEYTFFIDDCDNQMVNVIPPNPIKEGYEFTGWYTDDTYTDKWDFDNIIPSKQYDNGNYIFKETSIFAKFEVRQ